MGQNAEIYVGTFRNYAEQVKMAGKFNEENMDYEKFVKRQIHLINEINDDKKVDYFAQVARWPSS